MKKLVIILFCVWKTCFALDMDEIKKEFLSGIDERKNQSINDLSSIIDDPRQTMDVRVGAVDFVAKHKVSKCINVIIKNINAITKRSKSLMPLEFHYPCIGAIISIGEPSVTKLTQAISKENNALRLRLLSYVLMKIKSKEETLKYLDGCLASEITEAQRKCFNVVKDEVSKWHEETPRN